MELGIRGRRALVTAAGGGMGRNIALALAAEGADLVLFSRSVDTLTDLAREIRTSYDVDVVVHGGDMTRPRDVQTLASLVDDLGGPDIAVLLTGRPPTPLRPTLEETDLSRWQEAYDVQLAALVQVVNVVAPLMVSRGGGRIIAVTSAHAKEPAVGHALSSVFRAGATAYLKGLASEIGGHGITVNCVAPALIDTSHRTGAAAYTPEQTAHRAALSPLGRAGTQEELCAVVAFLASVQAGFITGSTIVVDGGMTGSLF